MNVQPDLYDLVMALIRDGLSDKKIARRLGVSHNVPFYYRRMTAQGKRPAPYKKIDAEIAKEMWRVGEHQTTPRGVARGGNNRLPDYKIAKIKELIGSGLSSRTIAETVGCGKGTAMRYLKLFKSEGPECEHGISIYLCPTCCTCRRSIENGDLVMARGPRAKNVRNQCGALNEILEESA